LLATALNKRNDPTTHVPPISPFEEFTFKWQPPAADNTVQPSD
jgi:hypothetical protein